MSARSFGSIVFLLAALFAGRALADEPQFGSTVVVDGASGDLVAAGADVTVRGDVEGDLAAFGANVLVEGRVFGDAFAAGANVDLPGRIDGDLAVFASSVVVSGAIDGDLAAAAGDVVLDTGAAVDGDVALAGAAVSVREGAIVGGDLAAAGADLKMLGRVEGDAALAGARVILDGLVDGDVQVTAEALIVGPQARISGDLQHSGPTPAQIDPGAVIEGDVSYERLTEAEVRRRIHETQQGLGGLDGLPSLDLGLGKYVLAAISFVMTAASGAALGLLFPAWFAAGGEAARGQPFSTTGVGFAIAILAPIASILAILFVVTAPLGLVGLTMYFVLLAAANIGAGYGVGAILLGGRFEEPASPLMFLVGLAIVTALALVPFVGWLFAFLGWSLGVGVVVRGALAGLRGASAE